MCEGANVCCVGGVFSCIGPWRVGAFYGLPFFIYLVNHYNTEFWATQAVLMVRTAFFYFPKVQMIQHVLIHFVFPVIFGSFITGQPLMEAFVSGIVIQKREAVPDFLFINGDMKILLHYLTDGIE